MSERVVFDCNVYFQSLISPQGPAGAWLSAVVDGRLTLFITETIINELIDVCLRPHLSNRFGITDERIGEYVNRLRFLGQIVESVPHVFDYERDPKDEHYIDLAIATKSRLLVSRDKDLLALNDPDVPETTLLRRLHPEIEILTPVEMIKRLKPSM